MTPSQITAIKADIAASPDLVGKQDYQIAALYNLPAVPNYDVWRTEAPVKGVYEAIDGTKYTPADTPLLADLPAKAAWFLNLCGMINIKQMQLQNLLIGKTEIDASKAGTRSWLKDAVTGVPAGPNGAAINPGGANATAVMNTLIRPALRIEKLLVLRTEQTGVVTAGVMGREGTISPQEISDVLNLL